jgi:peptidyl-prolyl cis-trans isomerase SurA
MTDFLCRRWATGARVVLVTTLSLTLPLWTFAQSRLSEVPNTADFIVAIVNQDVVTHAELQQRMARIQEGAAREKTPLPAPAELQRQVLDLLINERVQITNARETGPRVDEAEIDRAVAGVALQNQLTLPQLRERLEREGLTYVRLRNDLRDQLMMERVREREVNSRIRIGNEEIEAEIERRRLAMAGQLQLNLAQILVSAPAESASASSVMPRRLRAEAALARVQAGEAFEAVAKEISEDGNREQGGVIGLRAADRLPDAFVTVARGLKPGEVAPTLLVSSAGFHVLKLLERSQSNSALTVQQTRARHILLRPSAQLSTAAATRRLSDFKRQILNGAKSFEQIANENSEDGSAQRGGDLGWSSLGALVPEFEEAMSALAIKGISEPVVSRFGVHLIQVLERRETAVDAKQQREQARNNLREKKFEAAYIAWLRELRGRAYVELRELPLTLENTGRSAASPVPGFVKAEPAR